MNSSLHLCWARGALRPRSDVRPALDERAFRYGDGVFTTLSLSRGRLLDAALHMKRLRRSAAAIGLSVPDSVDTASSLARILASMGVDGSTDGVVRIQLSAGAGGRGYGRDRSTDAWELVEVHAPAGERRLTVAILAEEEAPVPALPHVKSCSSLAHVMCAMAADRRGVVEAVRTTGNCLLEAAAANLFWLADGELFTPSATLPIYPGVTRSVVLETARGLGWTVHEGEFGATGLTGAAGAFLVNAARGVEAIAELDGSPLEWPEKLEVLREAIDEARVRGSTPVAGPSDGRPSVS